MGSLWYNRAMEPYLTKDIVLLTPSLAEAISRVSLRRSDVDSDDFADVVSEALTLYHAKGRADVDDVGEMLADGLRLSYVCALRNGLHDQALCDALVEAIVEESTTTCTTPGNRRDAGL